MQFTKSVCDLQSHTMRKSWTQTVILHDLHFFTESNWYLMIYRVRRIYTQWVRGGLICLRKFMSLFLFWLFNQTIQQGHLNKKSPTMTIMTNFIYKMPLENRVKKKKMNRVYITYAKLAKIYPDRMDTVLALDANGHLLVTICYLLTLATWSWHACECPDFGHYLRSNSRPNHSVWAPYWLCWTHNLPKSP